MNKKTLEVIRGDTLSFAFSLEFDSNPQMLEKANLTCRKNIDDSTPIFQKSLNNGIEFVKQERNKTFYSVRIAPEDTNDIDAGRYFYDLSIELNGDVFTIIHGMLIIENDITR